MVFKGVDGVRGRKREIDRGKREREKGRQNDEERATCRRREKGEYRRKKEVREKIEANAGIERGLWVKDAESENQRVSVVLSLRFSDGPVFLFSIFLFFFFSLSGKINSCGAYMRVHVYYVSFKFAKFICLESVEYDISYIFEGQVSHQSSLTYSQLFFLLS